MVNTPKEPHTILLVGTGSIGQRHTMLLAERRDVDLWLCDTSNACLEQARRVAPDARVFSDYEQALKAGPQIVYVCTPHQLHRPMSVAALRAGCHVFCEKPLAERVDDAAAIVDAAAATQRTLQVGYLMRFHPIVKRLRDMIASGELGTLVGGRAMVGTYFTLMASRNRFREPQADALILDYTHQTDYLSLLFGPATRVSAECATLGKLELMQTPNVFAMTIRYDSGAIVQLHLDYVQYPNRHILELYGDRRSVHVEFESGELRSYGHGDEAHRVEHMGVERNDLMRQQTDAFLKAVSGEGPVSCTGADGASVLRVVEAALQSARELRAVEVAC